MRKLIILGCIFSFPALAGETKSVEEVTAEANGLISALQSQRNACNDQVAQAAAQIAKLSKEIEAAKAKVKK